MTLLIEKIQNDFSLKNADIFYRQAFFNLHATSDTYYLGFAKTAPENLIGCVQLTIDIHGQAKSPIRGTYGGIYLNPGDFGLQRAEEALIQLEAWLRQKQVSLFELTLPPFSADAHAQVWTHLLLRYGYEIKHCDLNYAIEINSTEFEQQVNYACLKKLRQIQAANLTARELSVTEFEAAHHLISQNRERKGRRLSMDWIATLKMQQAFPADFKMVGAFKNEKLHAAAIFIRVNTNGIYVFAWGDDGEINQLTPTTLLAKWLYQYCQIEHIHCLDLGISTEAGIPNLGLANYKLSLGAKESLKLTLRKNL